MQLVLREVRDEDLPLLFEQWTDPVAMHMAAFTVPDHTDWDAFERRWTRLRADESVLAEAIVVDDEVAGTIGSWGGSGEREVTYWIGRSYWGRGIATDALMAFLAVERSRPLHAHVASDNGLDIRPALVNGIAGAVTFLAGRPFSVAAATVRNGKIVELDFLADPERLSRLDLTIFEDA